MAIKYVGPNALKKLCSLVKTALAGKINTSDIVQTTSATGSTKVPSADVTNDLQDQVDELNTNLGDIRFKRLKTDGNSKKTISLNVKNSPYLWINLLTFLLTRRIRFTSAAD